jgi:hypothetical protein
MVPQYHLLTAQKGNPTLLDNYRPIALMNNLLKLWTSLIKDAGSEYVETHGILSDPQDGFRLQRSIYDAMASIIIMIEDAKIYNEDIYIMYADFKGALNAADHRIMFKHMRQLGMPPTFVDTCEHLDGVFTTDYITPYGSTPSIDINRGTLHGDSLSPSYLPCSSNPSSDGLQSVAEATAAAPPALTLTPHNPRRPTMATVSPTISASLRAPPQT